MATTQHPVYTEKNNCQDCYKCLRQCPVKAIRVEDYSASIISERCIYCGHCVQICPVGAKKIRDDLSLLSRDLKSGAKIIACIAPSYLSEFPDISSSSIVSRFKELGFWGVSETALGAELVAHETYEWLNAQADGVYISSCCPSAVDLICKYYPHLKYCLVPVLSPMQAHARWLRSLYGNEVKIAFFGPCVAKKDEADHFTELTDYALTFNDLQSLFKNNTTAIEADSEFIPFRAGKGNMFPVDGGMIANMKQNAQLTDFAFMSFSGVKHLREILNDIPNWKSNGKTFLELLICEGGCVKGPGTIDKSSAAAKRQRIIIGSRLGEEQTNEMPTTLDLSSNFESISPLSFTEISEKEIVSALHSVAKFKLEDELNCGGCGYDSCRDFARAMTEGKAERTMCVTYMRKVAQDKASVLLKKMPSGVVIVDENLKVVDVNAKFASILGGEVAELFDLNETLEGADLRKLISFHKLFASVLQTGEEMVEHEVRENDKYLHVSVISIQPRKIVCGVIENMREPEVQKDMVLNHTREVIKRNMEVVQKIAYLLGENASFTESMLNSILESHQPDDENK